MLVFKHQTKEQFMTRFHQRYRDSAGEETVRLGTWLLDKLDDGDFTDDHVIFGFGFKQSELVSFKARLNSWRSAYRQIKSAIGE